MHRIKGVESAANTITSNFNTRQLYLASFSQIMEKEIFVRLRAERTNEVQNAMAHLQAAAGIEGKGGGEG